mmetsp:Transcript_6056/g.15615  ORF Transcript_6056/g.15615 Transcript_6056/m.15615 type:complete len:187 (+) Transcript_6056:154-714(+)
MPSIQLRATPAARPAAANQAARATLRSSGRLSTRPSQVRPNRRQAGRVLRATEDETAAGEERELTEAEQKQKEIDDLRAQEKFALIGSGKAICKGCGYEYEPKKGDPEYPVAPGTPFDKLPEDWNCPTCGAPAKLFELDVKEVAGFAVNQGYGLGSNSMTGEQKSLLIYGSLLAFFFLFICGYFLN